MDGFLDAIDDRQGCEIVLADTVLFVNRARLGRHLRLAMVATEFDAASIASEKTAYIEEYFSRCNIQIKDASAIEIVEAFVLLRVLNRWQVEIPWLVTPVGWSTPPLPAYHYPQRWWATWIHEIASRYGWSRDEILNLWPEEAAMYLQEIQTSEYNETENRRALSEVSYEYNESTKKSKFRAMPKPGWMMDERLPENVRVNVQMLPVGAIVPM